MDLWLGEVVRNHYPNLSNGGGIQASAWLVLIAGIGLIVWVYPQFQAYKSTERLSTLLDPHLWATHALGKEVVIPMQDAQGFNVPNKHPLIVVSLGCGGCSSKEWAPAISPKTPKPLLLFFQADFKDIPNTIKGKPKAFLIFDKKQFDLLPHALKTPLPQVALLNQEYCIDMIPQRHQSLNDFIFCGGTSR